MSRVKLIFVLLLLAVIANTVPQAQAVTTVEVTIAGAASAWQTMALAAYSLAGAGAGHWTSASNAINLTDSRVTPVNVDAGTIWIVWNSTATKVWSFTKTDSVVASRCYFAQPRCSANAPLANLSGAGSQQISSGFWGADSALPASVQSLFTTGTPISVAVSLFRPEDAAFANCRVNSVLGSGTHGGAASDGLDGLGYNAVNSPGVCPANGLGISSGAYVGTPIKSGYPGSTLQASVLAFNISGKDPISGTTIPHFTVVNIGAAPLVFMIERDKGQLASLRNAYLPQLEQVFSGTNCDASAFDLPAGAISIFVNEPTAGQMQIVENTLFRHPTVYTGTGTGSILGVSQESNVGTNNPLAGQAGTCLSGLGARYRAITATEETKAVQTAASKFGGTDGIGYGVFSYGNVTALANNPTYGYITLNNVDPLFASYGPQNSTGLGYDPGQPASAGTMPGVANLPASCAGTFPCAENQIWKDGLSFPNLRNGSYPAWSTLLLVSDGAALANAKTLTKVSQEFVVTSVPDYVPAVKTVAGGITDPGLTLVRSHYQQYDGSGALIGAAPVNHGTTEAGGDLGGQILPCTTATACSTIPQHVQGNQGLQVRP